MINESTIKELSRDQLFALLKDYAKNWLAHDGCWFLSIEEKEGMEKAIEYDTESWRKFSAVEAKRIMNFIGAEPGGGLEVLAKALKFRLYSTVNEDSVEFMDDNTLRYYVTTCRVQAARRRKGLPDFPCKSVGIVEYSVFAETIDPAIKTQCISCPPEITDDKHTCIWEFSI